MEVALSSTHANEWKSAADAEFKSLIENETWELVEPLLARTLLDQSGYSK